MHKRKTSKYLISGILVLLFGYLNEPLQAADQPESATVDRLAPKQPLVRRRNPRLPRILPGSAGNYNQRNA